MIYKITNKSKLNFFNPVYEYYIYENTLDTNLNYLKHFILQKEKEILKKYPAWNDGYTGLGNDSLTSRYYYYNLLQYKELNFLKGLIRLEHDNFLNSISNRLIKENIYIQCWANVMRKGDQIKKHSHSKQNYGYLSGHICIDTMNTNTYYGNPYGREDFISENLDGKITLFPSWLPHYTDEVKTDLRITIAFDIITEETWNDYNYTGNSKSHYELLYK